MHRQQKPAPLTQQTELGTLPSRPSFVLDSPSYSIPQEETASPIQTPTAETFHGANLSKTHLAQPPQAVDDATNYPAPLPLSLLILGISIAAFLVALDRTIVATAIPQITDDFHAPNDAGWYGSAYLLTSCAFQPTYGRIYAHFDVRWSFLGSLGLFELGSLICGLANGSVMLIIGRAIAGLGCAGVFAGVLVIITLSLPLAKRPIYMALVGSIFGVGSVCGPIIGGAFTTKATWRWCFYFNLPCGALTFITLVLFFHPEKRPWQAHESFKERVLRLDLIGNLLLTTTVIMLLLALQWGGTTYPWSNSRVIGLLVGAGIESVIFIAWQAYRGDEALIPPYIVRQRTVAASFTSAFFLSGTLLVHSYYLPYWFQAIKNQSAITSGVATIPYLASNFICSMIAGGVVTKFGYFNPPALLGAAIATVGCGFLTTLRVNTVTARWIGFEVITGAGLGMSIQQGIIAVQAVLSQDVVPIATTLIMFAQSLSGAIFVAVGNSLLRNGLESGLQSARLPGVDIPTVLAAGATEVRRVVPKEQLVRVLDIYNSGLDRVFITAVPLAALGLLCALPMEWRSLKGRAVTAMEG
ncbi:MAG: hypothetical protein Q9218_005852 [Villophora microphyllina]